MRAKAWHKKNVAVKLTFVWRMNVLESWLPITSGFSIRKYIVSTWQSITLCYSDYFDILFKCGFCVSAYIAKSQTFILFAVAAIFLLSCVPSDASILSNFAFFFHCIWLAEVIWLWKWGCHATKVSMRPYVQKTKQKTNRPERVHRKIELNVLIECGEGW